jgi:predicted dehydrogenase
MIMSEKIRWGLLATGAIAEAFARGVKTSETGELVAVGSRTLGKAEAFGARFEISRCHGSYEELLADAEVDAVYVSTPHPQHAEWTIKAAEAGKHVLVEKPIGLNRYEAQAMFSAARENGVFLMEAYMYRCHPQTQRLVELLREQVIGQVSVIQATFSFQAGFDAQSRLWSNALAGGGIMDVGGYTTSIARLVAGAAQGKPFCDPISVTGAGHLHPETGVDAWAVGVLKFPGGIVASIATGVG